MPKEIHSKEALLLDTQALRDRLQEVEETLRTIRMGEVDALIVTTAEGDKIFTLQGAEHPYRVMVETMSEGALSLAADGTILYSNQRFADLVGMGLGQIIGSSLQRFVLPGDVAKIQNLLERSKTGGGREEIKLLAPGGNVFPVSIAMHSLETSSLGSVVGVVFDLTETVAAETALRRSEEEIRRHRDHLQDLVKQRTAELEAANGRLLELDRLKSMFIASMSHELRTPLNIIIGFTGILLQGMVGPLNEEQSKQLKMVKDAGAHLLALINDIIDLSKIEAGRVQPSLARFDLVELAKEVINAFAVEVAAKGLALSASVPEMLEVESDRRRVKQILVNLIGNSVKFTDQGRIEVALSAHRGDVLITVRDTGIGIRQEDMGKIFTAFGKIVTEGREQEGSGLGLYLSQKLAHLLGGHITVESEFGVGSVFTLALPRAARGS